MRVARAVTCGEGAQSPRLSETFIRGNVPRPRPADLGAARLREVLGRSRSPVVIVEQSPARIAAELFYVTAVPALVREVAGILAPLGIEIMPLKGALLQRLVYGTRSFRAVSDVDVLVPPDRFDEARSALRGAGFTVEREEQGGWEVALRRPEGLLELDLHQRLSSTSRSALNPEDLFRRGTRNTSLFGAPVVILDGRDLYAHLLLHMTLTWLAARRLHHVEDLEAVPAALGLSPATLAEHLGAVGLRVHAGLMLPFVSGESGSEFTRQLREALRPTRRERFLVELIRRSCARSGSGAVVRRLSGFVLAPSWSKAAREAIAKRVAPGRD